MVSRWLTTVVLFCGISTTLRADVGAQFDIAPQAPEARHQVWAAAAWCESGGCWLVVWREGYLNDRVSDIWCARVAADGKSLDPQGIRLTDSKGLNNRPRVASDGKGFLVVWETYHPSGTEQAADSSWNVVARRVSADGQIDKNLLVIAGGPHNQCRPDVVFAKGHYVIAWMGYQRGIYGVHAIRYLPDGKPADDRPIVLARHEPKDASKPGPMMNALLPVLATDQEGNVLATFFQSILNAREHPGYSRHLAFRAIDPATGKPVGPEPSPRPTAKPIPGTGGYPYEQLAPGLALGRHGGLLVCRATGRNAPKVLSLCQLTKSGEVIAMRDFGSSLIADDNFYPLQMRPAVAFSGNSYLVVSDCLSYGSRAKKQDGARERYVRIIGWKVMEDGKMESEDGFVLAGTESRQCLLPSVAAGPQGTYLVVYSEVRGVDNTKVAARLVK
jgi:hypothetical protein